MVGCFWRSNDRVCADIASRFYSRLFSEFLSPWKDEKVALAPRKAVMAVRADDVAMQLDWAQFIHYGL